MRIGIAGGLGMAILAFGLASCGGRQPLHPIEGQKSPAVPIGAAAPPTTQQLLTPPIQALPERNAELLIQSEQRKDDPFDLPPERHPQ